MKIAINLLPTSFRKQALIRRRAVQWSTVLCVIMSVVWGARWYKLREFRALNQQLEAVSREGRPAQAMLQEVTAMRQKIQRLQQQEVVARELDQQRHVLSALGAVSQAAARSNGKLRVTSFQAVELQSFQAAEKRSKEELRPGTVTLSGVSLDGSTVAEFHDALLRSGLFADVKLIKSNEHPQSGVALYDYEVSCEL